MSAYDEHLAMRNAELKTALCELADWAKGNRGSKQSNPYLIPEVRRALKLIARIDQTPDWMEAKTSNG